MEWIWERVKFLVNLPPELNPRLLVAVTIILVPPAWRRAERFLITVQCGHNRKDHCFQNGKEHKK